MIHNTRFVDRIGDAIKRKTAGTHPDAQRPSALSLEFQRGSRPLNFFKRLVNPLWDLQIYEPTSCFLVTASYAKNAKHGCKGLGLPQGFVSGTGFCRMVGVRRCPEESSD